MEGTLSQILFLGPSFDFKKSRKITKVFPFFDIESKPGPVSKF